MQWAVWYTLAARDTLLDCKMIAPSDIKKFFRKMAKLPRWKKKHIDEMEKGVWFEPIRTFSRITCNEEWT